MRIGTGIGISFSKVSGDSNTPRVAAFLTATGITDSTIINALNTMDAALVTAGLLPSGTGAGLIKALYPNVGGTATTHKFNFVNPADTDAAFRVVFNGGWTHNSSGATSNGTNAYADTFINPTTHYSGNTITWGTYRVQTGANVQVGTADLSTYERSAANTLTVFSGGATVSQAMSSNGMNQMSRIDNSNVKINNNGTKTTKASAFTSKPNSKFNYGGTAAGFYSAGTWKLVYFADLLSDVQQDSISTINSAFQTTLGRL
jgi:hypothetical protein